MNILPEQQIKNLGETLGVDLALDEKEQALLLIDNKHPVSLRLHNNRWCFYAMLRCQGEHENTLLEYEKYMEINMFEQELGVGAICFEPKSRVLLYIGSVQNNGYSDELYQHLNTFILRADKIRYTLAKSQSSGPCT